MLAIGNFIVSYKEKSVTMLFVRYISQMRINFNNIFSTFCIHRNYKLLLSAIVK